MTQLDKNKEIYESFYKALNKMDKVTCLEIAKSALDQNFMTIPYLYEAVLEKSMYEIATNDKSQKIGIWQEHVQSGIIRTVIENTFHDVVKRSEPSLNQKVIVLCPKEEYHDLGARMTNDFLTLLGFESYFIGPNTPEEEIFNAIDVIKPDWVSISVTNFFHLSKLQDLVVAIKDYQNEKPIKVMVGGYAIQYTPEAKDKIKADEFPYTYDNLKKIKEAYYETSL